MEIDDLKNKVDDHFDRFRAAQDSGDRIDDDVTRYIQEIVIETLARIEDGRVRAAEKKEGKWIVNQWVKKAILLYFQTHDSFLISGAANGGYWWDKIPSRLSMMDAASFQQAGFRAVPGSVVRIGAYIGQKAILMPSFINIGAYVGEGTMVDSWATVGSCAQIGDNVHISGGVGIGGVLEPLQAHPVIIENQCFIGARSEIVEGCIVGEGSVLAPGVFIGMSTKIVNRETGQIHVGEIPPYSVVVPGTLPGKPLPNGTPGPGLYCAVIVKQVDAKTRSKTSINELLRD